MAKIQTFQKEMVSEHLVSDRTQFHNKTNHYITVPILQNDQRSILAIKKQSQIQPSEREKQNRSSNTRETNQKETVIHLTQTLVGRWRSLDEKRPWKPTRILQPFFSSRSRSTEKTQIHTTTTVREGVHSPTGLLIFFRRKGFGGFASFFFFFFLFHKISLSEMIMLVGQFIVNNPTTATFVGL